MSSARSAYRPIQKRFSATRDEIACAGSSAAAADEETVRNPAWLSGSDARTHVSLLAAPAEDTSGSEASVATRARPPGSSRYDPSCATANVRSTAGRATSVPASNEGAVATGTISWAAHWCGCASIRRTSSSRCTADSSAPTIPRSGAVRTLRSTKRSSAPSTIARSRSSPHHHVGTDGTCRSWPSRWRASAGRNAGSAGCSTTPDPSGFATETAPRRTISTNPGIPSSDSGRSSRGSHQSSSTRRTTTSTRSLSPSERSQTAPPRTSRSGPWTSGYPRYEARKACSK